MTVTIRLDGDTPAELDTYEAALRTVVDAPATKQDYANRRGPGARRFLKPTGVRTAAAAGDGEPEPGPSPRAVAEGFKRGRDLLGEISSLRAADADLERRPWFPLQPGDVVLMHLAADEHSPAYGETYLAVDDDTDIAGNAMLRQISRTPSLDVGEPDPEYLLRYDSTAGRWELHSDLGDGLQPWRSNPELTDPEALADAQMWAHQYIQLVDPDALGYLQWREHGDGLVPWFLPLGPPPGEQLTPFYELWFEAGASMLTVIRAGVVVHGRPAATAAEVSR